MSRRCAMVRWVGRLVMVAGVILGVDRHGVLAQDGPADQGGPVAAELFDDSQLHTIELTIHPRDWEELRANFLLNTYYPAYFEWRGQRIENVGIRSRGTGSRSDRKPGLRVDFDRFADAQTFLGLKSVILRNNIQDATGLNERMAMKLFARLGLPAPRQAHVKLMVNGAYAGLYTVVEPIDRHFLDRTYGQSDGHLYEYDYDVDDEPYRFEYLGPEPDRYSPKPFKPVTHERDPDAVLIAEMIRVVAESTDPSFVSSVSEYLDIERFVTLAAVESFIGESDGLLGDRGMNNFYLYRFGGRTDATVIPWDKSEAFKGDVDRGVWRNVFDLPSWEQNRLITRVMRLPEYRALFLDTLLRCADIASEPVETMNGDGEPGPAIGWLESEVRTAYAQIRDAAREDPATPFPPEEFELGVSALLDFVRDRIDFVRTDVERSPR